jgi:hypothetical protein
VLLSLCLRTKTSTIFAGLDRDLASGYVFSLVLPRATCKPEVRVEKPTCQY